MFNNYTVDVKNESLCNSNPNPNSNSVLIKYNFKFEVYMVNGFNYSN